MSEKDQSTKRKIAVRIWLALLPLEFAAAILSYWTIGWSSVPFLISASAFLNFLFCGVYFAFSAWPGLVLALSYGLLLVGYHGLLGIRWYFVDREAQRIVEWVYSEASKSGTFPQDLSDYGFRHPEYKGFVNYERIADSEGESFVLHYYVGTDATDHRYTPEYGWYYNDD